MDFEYLLLNQLSRKFVDYLVEAVSEQPKLFDSLYPFIYADKERLAWRTGWVLCHIQEKLPALFDSRQEEMLAHVQQTTFHGVRRSLLYLISNAKYAEYPVDFINACFDWMLSPKQTPAVQVYSMYCLENVCAVYPDFIPELIACLEHIEPSDYSKGFNAARTKTMKRLLKKNK